MLVYRGSTENGFFLAMYQLQSNKSTLFCKRFYLKNFVYIELRGKNKENAGLLV